VHHCEIERSKVFVEWEVSEIVVNVEEKGILEVLWWSKVTHPVKLILDNFNWSSYRSL